MLSCRTCSTLLHVVENPHKAYHCTSCNEWYPVVLDVPVLIKNPSAFLARTFIYNDNFIRYHQGKIAEIAAIINSGQGRAPHLLQLQTAMESNLGYLKVLQDAINPFIKKEELFDLLQSKEEISFYGGTLDYLKRDWTWGEDGERELKLIYDTLAGFVEKYPELDKSKALVIGAGAGRTAWDLCKLYDDVYAVDSSFCLVSYFHALLRNNIRFYHVNDRNVYSVNEIAMPYEASLHPPIAVDKPSTKGKMTFFAGYATKIFLPSASLNLVTSIYFTDILPFRDLLKEVSRLLKPGGLFMHFGPLGYHFANPENCFSAEEIKEILQDNHFSIREEARVVASHTYSGVSMTMNVLNNWAFVAVKNEEPVAEIISATTSLKLSHRVNYDIKGALLENGEEESVVTIRLNDGELFQGSALVLDILRLCNGTTLERIVEEMTIQYGTDADLIRDNIKVLIEDLHHHGIITVVREKQEAAAELSS
jgi:carnosine N-methyltransferase